MSVPQPRKPISVIYTKAPCKARCCPTGDSHDAVIHVPNGRGGYFRFERGGKPVQLPYDLGIALCADHPAFQAEGKAAQDEVAKVLRARAGADPADTVAKTEAPASKE